MAESPELVELEIGPVAHGGHCVARHDGRVVFVRHTLPGERVRAVLTDAGPDAKFWRADAVEVLEASPDRVPSAWPAAGPGGVGGGELAHVALPAQRAWKAAVLREQLQRLGRVERDVVVHAAPGDDERGGLAWRTRIDLVTDAQGRAGMRGHRSHDVTALEGMPLAVEDIAELDLFSRRWPVGARLEAVAPVGGDRPLVLVDGVPFDLARRRPDTRPNARTSVREVVVADGVERSYRVAAAGFWQVHREAPATLVSAVLRGIGDVAGATVLDLYSGSGLFTAALADAVGPSGEVVSVEGDARAVRDARRNLHDRTNVELHAGDVARVLSGEQDASSDVVHADVVVLDPPRAGAGRRVLEAVSSLRPERLVYVACDPAALGRDVALLASAGYELVEVDGYDLFPMTHHVEAVATFAR
ncbi:MAG: methyltransferase domain-containing protein [Cellulomonas sp.]|uniref:23S rRNA methyltransferase n=3 Tax=Cellulomonas TaxID=1707 RepID=A0A4Y3KNG5_9CELL|nr:MULTISPECIES: methyltransferase domain-containing protein [Cellulomonas]MCR6647635.1 methyltransferase domain-containing protein [Cellulomonas sp.]MCR6703625.1 methyltransferase domain-containing protein [Cellulomonas sp.]GEA85196.1 23S rRNA methyltransferase [Cellulomonas gelida]GGL39555.1 23S rRNA methyltransferase [Cellulomonas gelida]